MNYLKTIYVASIINRKQLFDITNTNLYHYVSEIPSVYTSICVSWCKYRLLVHPKEKKNKMTHAEISFFFQSRKNYRVNLTEVLHNIGL